MWVVTPWYSLQWLTRMDIGQAFHDEASGTFIVACGSGESAQPVVRIWQAKIVDENDCVEDD